MSAKTIVLVDDDAAIRTVLSRALGQAGYKVLATSSIAGLWQMIDHGIGDVVVTDVMLPDGNVFDLFPKLKTAQPQLPILVMSAKNTMMTAITATEKGAFDYLPKPFDLNQLVAAVGRAMEMVAIGEATLNTPDQLDKIPIIGRSPAMQEIYRIVARLTQNDLTVIIVGESGTGKELVAKALHNFGKSKTQPFVTVNMTAIPRELIEAELFGHEKNSDSGEMIRRAGRFEQAQGGTLFLDEIGDMPLAAQTRLLQVLQQGEFIPVGGSRVIKVDMRIIAATHRDLRQLIAQGQFREDLFHRLNVVPLRLPPLRERTSDIDDLVAHFIKQTAIGGLSTRRFSVDAMARLKRHNWPGNIRELENLVARIMAIYSDDVISLAVVEQQLSHFNMVMGEGASSYNAAHLSELVSSYLAEYFAGFGDKLPPNGLYERVIREVETPLITTALLAVNGNQLKAAALLGINRNTLRSRIKELDIRIIRSTNT